MIEQFKSSIGIRQERIEQLYRLWSRLTQSTLSIVGVLMVLSVIVSAIFAPYIAPYPADASAEGTVDFAASGNSPSIQHLMGTDVIGRDVLSRILFGTRISLLLGAVVLTIAILIGVALGLVAGYFGGWINTVIMRVDDVFLSIPAILLPMAISAALGPSLRNSMIAISFVWWAWYARLVQGEVLSVKQNEYVKVSESLGAGWFRVTFREILPNIVSPIIVKATLDMGFVILVGASLSFLGLGANPPTPSWGAMIADGRANLTNYPWIATFPGLAISYTVLGFNLLGDGLRDVFDVEVER